MFKSFDDNQYSSESSPHLQVEGLSWGCRERQVLHDVGFTVNHGEFVGLLGPNGVGKSTLLRCLYRYLVPQQGRIALAGAEIGTISRRAFARQVAVVTQHGPSGFSMTVRQFLTTGLLAHSSWWQRLDRRDESARVEAVLQRVKLASLAEHHFDSLSGGERQRVLIARALLQQPKLLLLDEPTNHLDVRYQIETLKLVRSLGVTVVASIHDLNLASAYCDRILLLSEGTLVASGRPQQVLTADRIRAVYGVEARVDMHPNGRYPRITYDYQKPAYALA
ncbi:MULTISPECIES: ABC transporter ATP-binding protein [Ferrimonas]|uniref:ABC transporter ATP-binding protein n=1 Tax=Ferrimonas TaxID=44011 RepID=UPI00041E83B3|nr:MULTISPECIES: ABC transporter ATP-binding protein [Ferrimonas]USD39377.1 ABC transporter ATP-binding protein [Ferrimonas sp. SCSIO 43195]